MAERHTVLVVDDEPDIREALQVLLSEIMGMDVTVAASAPAGLDALAKSGDELRIIISDYRMPQMDGLQFLAEAARRRPEVRRILLTAYADTQLAVDALNRAGVAHFLTKPVDPAQLEAVVRRLLAEDKADRLRKSAFDRASRQRFGP